MRRGLETIKKIIEMKGKRAKINSIMMQTDFRKIKDSFLANGITWRDESDNEYIPSQGEIEFKAREMLEKAANSTSGYYKAFSGNILVRKSSVSLELGFFIEYKYA